MLNGAFRENYQKARIFSKGNFVHHLKDQNSKILFGTQSGYSFPIFQTFRFYIIFFLFLIYFIIIIITIIIVIIIIIMITITVLSPLA